MEDAIGFLSLMAILTIWSGIWKGMALWRAGTRKELTWFVVLFIFNTAGILPILYLYVFSKDSKEKKKKT